MGRCKKTLLFLVIAGCAILGAKYYMVSSNIELRNGLQITTSESRKINCILEHFNITVARISDIDDNINGFSAYELVDEKENKYILVLQDEDRRFSALLDEDGKVLEGIVDYDLVDAAS